MDHKTYQDQYMLLQQCLAEYLDPEDGSILPSADDKMRTYTESAVYISATTAFHFNDRVAEFFAFMLDLIKPDERIIDVGCCSGFTGLLLMLNNRYNVQFHDFDGLGLSFVRSFLQSRRYSQASVVPYGDQPKPSDWVVALDVLEHTGNHLGFLHYLDGLGDKFVVTYPLMTYRPPFVNVIDEWVDDVAIEHIIDQRYDMIKSYTTDGRRYMIYTRGA